VTYIQTIETDEASFIQLQNKASMYVCHPDKTTSTKVPSFEPRFNQQRVGSDLSLETCVHEVRSEVNTGFVPKNAHSRGVKIVNTSF
jgi:hypothetical protein